MFNSNSINADVQYKGMLNHIITTGVDTSEDRKSTRLNSSTFRNIVCRILLEKT